MIPDFLSTTLLSIVLFFYFHFIGRGLCHYVFKETCAEFFSILGLGFFSSLVVPFIYIFGVSATLSLVYFLSMFVILTIPQFKNTKNDIFPQLFFSFFAIIISLIVVSGLYIKLRGDVYFPSMIMFDHLKVGIIDAIKREGLPVINPFTISVNNDGQLHYYLLWYATAALIASALHISGWVANIIMTFSTAAASFLTIAGIYRKISGVNSTKIKAISLIFLISISGSSTIFFGMLFGSHSRLFFSGEHPLEPWLVQASWVPQHIASASLMCFLIVSFYSEKSYSLRVSLVQSMLISSCFGMSAWIGSVVFGMTSIFLFLLDLCTGVKFKLIIKKWLTPALISVAISYPMIVNQMDVSIRNGRKLLDFSVFPTLDNQSSLLRIISYFSIYMIICFPMLYPAFLGWLCKKKKDILIDKDKQVLLITTISSMLISLFIKSSIENNDLGWRAIIPAVIIMSAFSADFVLTTSNKTILFLIGMLFCSSLLFTKSYVVELMLGEHGGKIERVIERLKLIEASTLPTDRILLNNQMYDSDVYNNGFLPVVITNRRMCFTNLSYANTFSGGLNMDFFNFHEKIKRFYNGESLDVGFLTGLGCNVIMVTADDLVWNKLDIVSESFSVTYLTNDLAMIRPYPGVSGNKIF